MSEEALRKNLTKHQFIAEIRKSRNGYYVVTLEKGIFSIKDGRLVEKVFPDTMAKLQELLNGYSDDNDLRKIILEDAEEKRKADLCEAEKKARMGRTVTIRPSEKYPLAYMVFNDCTFEMGAFYIPPFCKNEIGKIITKDLAGLDQWRDSSLATVGLEIERLTKIKNDLEAMDIASYQEAFRKLQDKYSRYVESGEMSCD